MGGILCLTCDNMGSALNVGLGKAVGPEPGEPSLEVGLPRWLDVLDRVGLTATFFTEGWNGLHHPEQVKDIVARGHEIGLHGWVHERYAELSAIDAERVLVDSQAAFRNIGIKPRGFRAPGVGRGEYTLDILKRLGVEYDSSILDPGNEETEPSIIGEGIVNIPYRIRDIDYWHYHSRQPRPTPETVEQEWNDALDETVANGSVMTLIFHANTIGVYDEWLAMAERLLRRAKAKDGLEILRGEELADRVKARQLAAA